MMSGVVFEVAEDGSWHARAADLPVFSCAGSRGEVEREIRAAIAFHVEEDVREGRPMPPLTRTMPGWSRSRFRRS